MGAERIVLIVWLLSIVCWVQAVHMGGQVDPFAYVTLQVALHARCAGCRTGMRLLITLIALVVHDATSCLPGCSGPCVVWRTRSSRSPAGAPH